MLLSFSITNFRSFREEQTLSLVASNRQGNLLGHLRPIPDDDHQVLPIAVIYGANGAGKSNWVKGLAFVQRQVLFGNKPGRPIPWQPYLLGKEAPQDPSSFNLQFISGQHAFAYGFRSTASTVTEEWLVLLRHGRELILFERLTQPDGSVVIEPGEALTGDGFGDHAKVVALARVGVRANQLFLAAIRGSLDEAAYGPLVQEALSWFAALRIVLPEADFLPLADWIARDPAFVEFAGEFLRDADTGVQRLKVETVEIGEAGLGLPPDLLKELVEETPPGEVRVRRIHGLGDLIAQRDADLRIRVRRLFAEHHNEGGAPVAFPFEEEADGTQRLTHLLPAVYQLRQQPRVYVVDEIDRSLHPLLALKFIEYFLTACQGGRGQLILTTHETQFLDQELLRRDEYWFATRDHQKGTELYSLDEYRVRTDLRLDKGYLYGRFGAVPLLGGLERQMDTLRAP